MNIRLEMGIFLSKDKVTLVRSKVTLNNGDNLTLSL